MILLVTIQIIKWKVRNAHKRLVGFSRPYMIWCWVRVEGGVGGSVKKKNGLKISFFEPILREVCYILNGLEKTIPTVRHTKNVALVKVSCLLKINDTLLSADQPFLYRFAQATPRSTIIFLKWSTLTKYRSKSSSMRFSTKSLTTMIWERRVKPKPINIVLL